MPITGVEKQIPVLIDNLKEYLDSKVVLYNRPDFIAGDPVQIPHRFTRLQDIEIAGLLAATLAWGQRTTIIKNCVRLLEWMDHAPYDFIVNHSESDLHPFGTFCHRTFNGTDTLYFISFLHWYYQNHQSLEDAFAVPPDAPDVENGLVNFHRLFFHLPDHPLRTKKHVATPERGSACKRLNMFLRWMVRKDNMGVDFGLWRRIHPSQLICPCDVHVERVARRLKLITRKPVDWLTAKELTQNLKTFDPVDPVKYDFALFGLGLEERLRRYQL